MVKFNIYSLLIFLNIIYLTKTNNIDDIIENTKNCNSENKSCLDNFNNNLDNNYCDSKLNCNPCFSKNFICGSFILEPSGSYKQIGSSFILISNPVNNKFNNVKVILTEPFPSLITPIVSSTTTMFGDGPTIYGTPTRSSFIINNIQTNYIYFFIAYPTT